MIPSSFGSTTSSGQRSSVCSVGRDCDTQSVSPGLFRRHCYHFIKNVKGKTPPSSNPLTHENNRKAWLKPHLIKLFTVSEAEARGVIPHSYHYSCGRSSAFSLCRVETFSFQREIQKLKLWGFISWCR